MSVFVNVPADPLTWQVLEAVWRTVVLGEDGISKENVVVAHYHRISGIGASSLIGLANSFNTIFAESMIPLMNVRVTNNVAGVRPLDDPLVPEVQVGAITATGAVTGDPLSSVVAAVVQKVTGVRGRSFKGSVHFGGLSESDTDGGDELKASVITAWETATSAAFQNINDGAGNVFQLCVLSQILSGVNQTPPFFTGADVSNRIVNHILGTMRRRKELVSS